VASRARLGRSRLAGELLEGFSDVEVAVAEEEGGGRRHLGESLGGCWLRIDSFLKEHEGVGGCS
jgi:hypothetical protein